MTRYFFSIAYALVFGLLLFQCTNKSESTKNDNTNKAKDTTLTLPAFSQQAPVLLVRRNQKDTVSSPLQIRKVRFDTKVLGNIASTKVEITFYNDLERVLDGEFCFPLGEGQSVSYFAQETDDGLKEASVVEKSKGRTVYESIVRRRIDPALLEWTAGNNFRTRIYPIPALGEKKIIIGFEQELLIKEQSYLYYQPFYFKQKIDELVLHAEVLKQEIKPTLFGDNPVTVEFEKWEENWVANKTISNYTPNKPLAFAIPFTGNTQKLFIENYSDKKSYFHYSLPITRIGVPRTNPKHITLLWDASGSSDQSDSKKTIECIEEYLKKIEYPSIQLIIFSNEIIESSNYENGDDSWYDIKKKITSIVPDGGTQLGALDLRKYKTDEFILVTDGLSNFGDNKVKTSDKPVHTISHSPIANYSYLKYLSSTTGGNFINLNTQSSSGAIDILASNSYQFISAEYDKNIISEVYPSQPKIVDGNFSIAGITTDKPTELTLNFGVGGKIMHTEKVLIDSKSKDYNHLIPIIWAQKKLEELDVFYEANEEIIKNLGMQYGIVTRNTSLIILDDLTDYLSYKIEPKDPKMKKRYLSQLKANQYEADLDLKANRERIIKEFNNWKEWYNTDYVYVKPKTPTSTLKSLPLEVQADTAYILADSVILAPSGSSYQFSSNATGGGVSLNIGTANVLSSDNSVSSESVENPASSINLGKWEPNTPYMKFLKTKNKNDLYATYLTLKEKYKSTPSFFIDVSDYFTKVGEQKLAIRVLSNIAELELENHQLLRIMARRLQQLNQNTLAIKAFETILKLREEEPQSYRDLGLAYEQNKEYQKAIDVMSKVLDRSWDGRFPEVEVLVAIEMNHIISKNQGKLNLTKIDSRLISPFICDVRVVINWDTDNCDMDLWVTDPNKEKCYYSYPLTLSGGKLSRDFTGGYGPEVFMIKKATKGDYIVEVNYFGNHNESITGPTTVQAELYTNYGKANEVKKVITLRLEKDKDIVNLANLAFK